jgi:hypothetical protein
MRPKRCESPSTIVHFLHTPASDTRVESIPSYEHQAPRRQPYHLHYLSPNHYHERASILPRNMHTGVTGKCVKRADLQASRLRRPPSLANPRAIHHRRLQCLLSTILPLGPATRCYVNPYEHADTTSFQYIPSAISTTV